MLRRPSLKHVVRVQRALVSQDLPCVPLHGFARLRSRVCGFVEVFQLVFVGVVVIVIIDVGLIPVTSWFHIIVIFGGRLRVIVRAVRNVLPECPAAAIAILRVEPRHTLFGHVTMFVQVSSGVVCQKLPPPLASARGVPTR